MSDTPRGKCELCGGPLVPVGHARANGRPHKDWESRKYHKQCWYDLPREIPPVRMTPKAPADTPPRIIHHIVWGKDRPQ
jgi:hypothetical protein